MTSARATRYGGWIAICGSLYALLMAVLIFTTLPPKWQRSTVRISEGTDRFSVVDLKMEIGMWRACSIVELTGVSPTRCAFIEFFTCETHFVNNSLVAEVPALDGQQPPVDITLNACSTFDASRIFYVIGTAAALALMVSLRAHRSVPFMAVAVLAGVCLLSMLVVLCAWGANDFFPVLSSTFYLGYLYWIWLVAFFVAIATCGLHLWISFQVELEKYPERHTVSAVEVHSTATL